MKTLLSILTIAATAAPVVGTPAASFAATPAVPKAPAAKVALGRTPLGGVLADAKGRTLYLFEKDKRGRSSCYGACATYWPPLLTHGKPTAGARLKGSLLGVTKRADGTSQVTYAGHPLYRFAQDVRSGQVAGQNVDAFGAEWYVLSSSGKKIVKTAPKPTSATGAPSGY
jgi:predicted lipoprotein with Yx(FWY)xxD motif